MEPIKKTLKNHKVTRTALVTRKEVAYTHVVAENEAEVEKKIKEGEVRYQYDESHDRGSMHIGEIVNVEETITVEEVK